MRKHEFQKVGNALSSFHDNPPHHNDANDSNLNSNGSDDPHHVGAGAGTGAGSGAVAGAGPYFDLPTGKMTCEGTKPYVSSHPSTGTKLHGKQKRRQEFDNNLSKVLSIKAERIRHRILEEMKEDTALSDDESLLPLNFEGISHRSDGPSLPSKYEIKRKLSATDQSSRIPVSQARLKRREKQKVLDLNQVQKKNHKPSQVSAIHSTIDIRKYRPGYTWNKGGRVKELRIRCLARKFLHLWQRNTFGRVPLSLAVHHFEESLIRRTFGIWHDFWWEIVKEWRLGVRAECHLRHKVCLHAFTAWRQFVELKRIANSKLQSADKKYNENLLGKTWQCWLAYIRVKCTQLSLKTKADKFHGFSCLRNAWDEWRRQYFICESHKESLVIAVQFHSYRLQAQHWLVWKNAFCVRQQLEEQYLNASIYHNSVIALKCLRAWKLYFQNKQVKMAHYAFGERKYFIQLKSKCFNHWFQRWHLIRSLQQHQNQMETLAKTFRLRWAFWRWTLFVDSCHVQKKKEAVSQQHYNFYLLRLGLDSFRLNIVHTQIKVMRNQLSSQLAVSQLTRRTWNQWVEAFDQREEMKMTSSTHLAEQHYRTNLLLKCFTSLADYAKWRKLRKIQYVQADAHFFLHAVPKCLFHLKLNVELERNCRQIAIESKNFHRSITLQKTFHFWHARSVKTRDQRMMYRMAVLHNESVCLRNGFLMWRQRTLEQEDERENMWQAERHYMYTLFQKSFDAWMLYVDACRKKVLNERKAIIHHYCALARNSMLQWKKWMQQKAQMKIKSKIAQDHFSRKTLTACMGKWKEVRRQGLTFKSLADHKFVEHQKALQKKYLHEWQIVTARLAAKKRKESVAMIYYNRSLLSKVILEWHHSAAVKAYKHCQTQELLANALSQLQKLKLSLYWKHWLEERNKAKATQVQIEKANQHYHHTISQKAVHCWKDYTRECLRKRLLSRQCQWFHDVRLGAQYFLTWQERLAEKREENEKSQLALWHWSLSLQRKMLFTWLSYKDRRKHKKQRLGEASQLRRERLLRLACCQWLTTSDSLYQVRSSMAARYQTKAVMDSFLLVQRCAFHWRSWARKRKLTRANSDRREMPFTVPLIAKGRLGSKSSDIPIISNILPSQMVRSATFTADEFKPQSAATSPLRPVVGFTSDVRNGAILRPRPLPTRPAFLVESLQRAGLYSQMFSEAMADNQAVVEDSDGNSTLIDELDGRVLESPDRPSTGRFELHDMPFSQRSKIGLVRDTELMADSSFSAEVLSGSNSTMDPANSAMKPLHLSNTDTDLGSTQTTSSRSPPMFTPSTQRSQFSGNPLLFSSAVSDFGAAKNPALNDEDLAFGDQDMDGLVVRGNLEGRENNHFQDYEILHKGASQNQQISQGQSSETDTEKSSNIKENRLLDDTHVIWKPEDFMKKPPPHEKSKRLSSEESSGTLTRHTPRAFATWELEKLSEYAEHEGHQVVKSSDSAREGKGVLRHTPREVFSPRRVAPQGILHNKVSDSDGDVSPLNTARSRGTVTFASPKSPTPEQEIMNIRDRLKHFADQKKKLRSLRKQYRQLSDWLVAQADKQSEDEDSHNASEELDMIRLEVAQLQAFVDGQKPICERLVLRAQSLVAELNISF